MKPLKIIMALATLTCLAFVNPHHEPRKIKIVLDAGHGGNDFGAKHGEFTEKEITAKIIEKVLSGNKNPNVTIELTRLSDETVSLAERTQTINRIKPDLVLSLHVNYNANSAASGFEIYTPKAESANSAQSVTFAKKLAYKLEQHSSHKSRGIKEAPFMILNKSEVPAIVVELGFLSNAKDCEMLTDDSQQTRIANTLLEFITEME